MILLNSLNFRIFSLSTLILFLEMLLIRWVGTEVRIFAYLQNIILVICFLAGGMGCFLATRKIKLSNFIICFSLLAFTLNIPAFEKLMSRVSGILGSAALDYPIWYNSEISNFDQISLTVIFIVAGFVLIGTLLLLIWEIFIPLGSYLGRHLDSSNSILTAYSCNILGSLAGTLLFLLVSYLSAPPWIWVTMVSGLTLISFSLADLRANKTTFIFIFALPLAVYLLSYMQPGQLTVWSPYQKLTLASFPESPKAKILHVNGVGYQLLLDLSHENIKEHPDRFASDLAGYSHYDLPYHFHPNPKKVLIVGAGTGSDVAAALRHHAKYIVAVEIDPSIIKIGKAHHPENPYSSPRVEVVVDDARAFLNKTQERFDIIVFGLLDAHTATALTNVRLDHYIYTEESLRSAKKALAKGGVLALSFGMDLDYLNHRMAAALKEVFSSDPISLVSTIGSEYGWGGLMLLSGDPQEISTQISSNSKLSARVTQSPLLTNSEDVEVITDDWPYLYLKERSIPLLHILFAGLVAGLFIFQVRKYKLSEFIYSGGLLSNIHFSALGAGFLLLQTQNISKAALLLGNTWVVNSIVISAIMIVTLIANFIVGRMATIASRRFVLICLIALCIGLYFVNISPMTGAPLWQRGLFVTALSGVPVFFSSIAFAISFRQTSVKSTALGANLAGAMIGALLQSISFLTGISALLLVVASLYLIAFLAVPKEHSA